MNTDRSQVGWGFWLWWVLASTATLVVTTSAIYGEFEGENVGVILAPLAGFGAITGAVMVWLLRQPATDEPSLPQDAA
jgi:hypothetical protein